MNSFQIRNYLHKKLMKKFMSPFQVMKDQKINSVYKRLDRWNPKLCFKEALQILMLSTSSMWMRNKNVL